MNSEKKARQEYQKGIEVPIETPYLIEDLEELINTSFDTVFNDAPFRIKATDFHPELISGKESTGPYLLAFNHLPPAKVGRELLGLDLLMDFPIKRPGENPLNIAIKWSDSTQIRLAVAGGKNLLLAEESKDNGRTFSAEIVPQEVFEGYIESLGLPDSFWSNDIREVTQDLYNCPDLFLTRSLRSRVDLATSVEFVHDARLVHDIDDTKQLVQELCINIDHDRKDTPVYDNELYLPPQPKYRNMLRFERTDDNEAWKFAGAYRGALGAGELYDELVQIDPRLGIPDSKVLDKALAVLSQTKH